MKDGERSRELAEFAEKIDRFREELEIAREVYVYRALEFPDLPDGRELRRLREDIRERKRALRAAEALLRAARARS